MTDTWSPKTMRAHIRAMQEAVPAMIVSVQWEDVYSLWFKIKNCVK